MFSISVQFVLLLNFNKFEVQTGFHSHSQQEGNWFDKHVKLLQLNFSNPLTPRALCQKHIFWTFWRFSS